MLIKKIDVNKLYSLLVFPSILLLLFILKNDSVAFQETFKLIVVYYMTLLIGDLFIKSLKLEKIILKITDYKIIEVIIIILVIIAYEMISSSLNFTYVSCYLGIVSSFSRYFNMS